MTFPTPIAQRQQARTEELAEPRPPSGRRPRHRWAPYLFISPFYLLFLAFVAFPLVASVWISLFDTLGLQSRIFVGLGNYADLARDPLFWKSLWNTVYLTVGTLILQLPLALLLAVVLNGAAVRGKVFFRFAFFSPVLVAGVFIAIVFGLVFNHEYGMLNTVLASLGMDTTDLKWLQREELVIPALILTGVWRWTGYNMIYFLAGLQAIRQELYEAAALDGAGPWQSFVHVTWPGLRPVTLFVGVMSVLGSLQIFDLPYILLRGAGPNDAGLTTVMYLYRMGFQYMRLGYAAAIGWALFLIIFLVSVGQMRAMGRPIED